MKAELDALDANSDSYAQDYAAITKTYNDQIKPLQENLFTIPDDFQKKFAYKNGKMVFTYIQVRTVVAPWVPGETREPFLVKWA